MFLHFYLILTPATQATPQEFQRFHELAQFVRCFILKHRKKPYVLMNCDLLVIRYLKVTYITDKTYKADGDTQELNQYQIRSLETCYTCCTQCLFILLFTSCSPFSLGIKGVALVAVLELLILSRQASENHSWELASGLRPSCRWRQYLGASSYLDRCGCRPCPFSVGPFVFLVVQVQY